MGISRVAVDDQVDLISDAAFAGGAIDKLVNAVRKLNAACLPGKPVTIASNPRDDLVYSGFTGRKLLSQFLLILRYAGSLGDFSQRSQHSVLEE